MREWLESRRWGNYANRFSSTDKADSIRLLLNKRDKQNEKFALTALAAACFAAPVHAFDLGSMISAGTDLVKSATLSDADVKAMAPSPAW